MRTAHPEILQEIADKKALSDELIERMRTASDAFKAGSRWASTAAVRSAA